MDTMSLNRMVFTHGLMKKIDMNESCIAYTVHNKTTKLTGGFCSCSDDDDLSCSYVD